MTLGQIHDLLRRQVREAGQRRGSSSWREPLLGVASAADPLFEELRVAVGPEHAIPGDLLPDAASVIAYFLPFAHEIPRSNRAGRMASTEWARAYVETKRLIEAINDKLAAALQSAGQRAAVQPPTHNFDHQTLRSAWSHKHVAFIAGLGRFGTHHLLITAQGCSGRLGSLVTDLALPPTTRADAERCLALAGGRCHSCIDRCPIDALSIGGLDRHACYRLLRENEELHREIGKADVCGKCASHVPCALTDPEGKRVAAQEKRAARERHGGTGDR